MRANGAPLREIAAAQGVSLSSAWLWTHDISQSEPRAIPVAFQPREGNEAAHCGRCDRDLPITAFHRSVRGRQSWCRQCRNTYMRHRGDLHRRQTYQARERRRDAARAYILHLLDATACWDCGLADSVVLEFDHVGPKRAEVADLVSHGYSIDAIAQEVAACELVCVNCHRRRTGRRARSWRSDPARRASGKARPRQRRNLEFLMGYLSANPCVDCGEDDIVVLDFDHIGPKRGSVVKLAWWEHSLASIGREIAECEVRCANCHRRRTCRALGHFRNDLSSAPVAQQAEQAPFKRTVGGSSPPGGTSVEATS